MVRVPGLFRRPLIAVILFLVSAVAVGGPDGFRKTAADIDRKYTSVGSIGLTVTNFGTVGTRNAYWPIQPSCEYPRGSRIEHIWQGGLWVGAVLKTRDSTDSRNGLILVSTGATDRAASASSAGGDYEYNAEASDSIRELSALADERPPTSQFSPLAVSHQDFIADYTDRFTRTPSTGDSIINHIPLGLRIHQESYAWNFPFADFYVILRYVIYNAGVDTLDSVYVGFWDNAVVRNTNYVQPRTPGYFDNTGQGFDSLQRMAYSFDFNGAPGGPAAGSYLGLKLLGSTPFPSGVDSVGNLHLHTYYNAWQFRLSSGQDEYLSPTDDYNALRYYSRYSRMSQSMPQGAIDPLRVIPKNVTYLLSTGPFSRLKPGDSVEVVFAAVCAKKFGSDRASLDTKVQRQNLYANAGWAQQSYQGEDINGNNQLDPGEDIARRDSVSPTELGLRYEPDGKITRYLLPTPPRRPKVRTEVSNQNVVVYWDKSSAEESVDPVLGRKDFEGYRVYRSNTAEDFQQHENFVLDLSLVGEFDRADDNIGYNTGFGRILLDTAKVFPGDTVQYWYRFPPKGITVDHLNGWQYIYAVSAFDQGDSANNVPSLESARELHRVIPGTPPVSDHSVAVGVYPNPYYVNAYWDGARERQRKLYFYNLPARCQITVYTLAGDIVTVLEHDAATNNGQHIEWFSVFGEPTTQAQFSGGEHAWDLISRYDQAVATGLYLFTVRDQETGFVKRGKFMIIK
ncbi:MAG TPA: hypothetical protein VES59_06395 [Bacteroidota bacterium]|nr:hypothetical protein [Bacteroidota bacterium]